MISHGRANFRGLHATTTPALLSQNQQEPEVLKSADEASARIAYGLRTQCVLYLVRYVWGALVGYY